MTPLTGDPSGAAQTLASDNDPALIVCLADRQWTLKLSWLTQNDAIRAESFSGPLSCLDAASNSHWRVSLSL